MIHLPPDPVAPLPFNLGIPLTPLYTLAVARRNAKFDQKIGVHNLIIPIVSIGNLSVGGTGKTPLVKRVIYALKLAGYRPGVVLRGYGSKINGVSDEEAEHRLNNPGIPVAANPNRLRAISDLMTRSQGARVDCVVLDDAFQHRRIARIVDIVLVDATRNPFQDRLLPGGWLREPVQSLKRATAVVITHTESVAPSTIRSMSDSIEAVHGKPPLATTSHTWIDLTIVDQGIESSEQNSWLQGKKVVAVCAIARPRPFINELKNKGAKLLDAIVLRDHAPLNRTKADAIAKRAKALNADAIICTVKDWTKLRHHPEKIWPTPIVRPTLEHLFTTGLQEFDSHIVDRVGGKHR